MIKFKDGLMWILFSIILIFKGSFSHIDEGNKINFLLSENLLQDFLIKITSIIPATKMPNLKIKHMIA